MNLEITAIKKGAPSTFRFYKHFKITCHAKGRLEKNMSDTLVYFARAGDFNRINEILKFKAIKKRMNWSEIYLKIKSAGKSGE